MIKKCDCKHEYQDKLYGRYKRVHNPVRDSRGTGIGGYRCTVCEKVKDKLG